MIKSIGLALLGAVVGGAIGHFVFLWIAKQGFYAMILPGALVGFGATFGKARHVSVPIICGVLALALGYFSEWRFAPFIKDGSLDYFVKNISKLKPVTNLMIIVGGILGFWIPFRRQPRMVG